MSQMCQRGYFFTDYLMTCYNHSMTDTERLLSLSSADPGFYILALHAYIENTLKKRYPGIDDSVFWKMMDEYREILRNNGVTSGRELEFIYSLKREHSVTNRVRHQFETVSSGEAKASTWNFIKFLTMEGMGESLHVDKFRDLLKDWHSRKPAVNEEEYFRLKFQLIKLKKEHESFLDKYEQFREAASLIDQYESQIRELNQSTLVLNEKIRKKDERVDILRQERFELQEKLKEIEKQRQEQMAIKNKFGNFGTYLQALERLSSLSRTRTDFERDVLRTTPEQQRFIDEIDLTKDILVKGSAGTGKSLILLKALEKALRLRKEELGLSKQRNVYLLTYTNTLTKYNTYLSEVMQIENPGEIVTTALGFLELKLKEIEKDAEMDFTLWKEWGARYCPDFMNPFEFQKEVENFLWALDITEDEYINEIISRKGMGKPLRREHREKVWASKTELEKQAGPHYTRASAAVRLKRYLETSGEDDPLRDTDYLFVDESQDILPVELWVLKKLTLHSLILAGDTQQSIYQTRSPYARAGLKMRGNTRILHTNFRNTIPIHLFAENFRNKSTGKNSEGNTEGAEEAIAFREGPDPEIYLQNENAHLSELLIQKVRIFIEEAGYSPENISILIPSVKVKGRIEKGLEKAGYESVWVKDEDFDFKQEGVVRICPIHSSKGLDFPVVMLYLPFLYPPKTEDDEKKQRNLLYVAVTRAMDNLNIFVNPEKNPILKELVDSLDETV